VVSSAIWPENKNLSFFREKIEGQLGTSILLKNIQEHPDPKTRNGAGRYEPDRKTIWINLKHADNEYLYVLSHELAHAWQEAHSIPRVHSQISLLAINNGNDRLVDVVRKVFELADRISIVVLDALADKLVYENNILSQNTVLPLLRPNGETFDFDRIALGRELGRLKMKIERNSYVEVVSYWLIWGLGAATHACALAASILRAKQADMFTADDEIIYASHGDKVRELADRFIEIVERTDIRTTQGCFAAFTEILSELGIPDSVMRIY
jgi:hypothetical protein